MTKLTSVFEDQIKKFEPSARDIVVKIVRDHKLYSSKIHIRLPGMVIHTNKKGQNILEALNSAYEATLKQITKYKMKKRLKRRYKIWRWQEPSGPPP